MFIRSPRGWPHYDPQIGRLETSSEPPKPSMKEVETGSTMVFPAWAPHTGAAGAANRQGNGAKLWMSEAENRLIWEGRGGFCLWVFSGNGSRHHVCRTFSGFPRWLNYIQGHGPN